jgi:trehalose 2-sulfotransferase
MATPRNAVPERADSYFICATPRTGSSLLCGLLQSTGVAGRPESYFRQPDQQAWAARWGIPSSPDGTFSYADFVRAAITAGQTSNGVFAARIMWGTLDEVTGNLATVHPDLAGADVDLLNRAFGDPRFVYLRRGDVLAQAVSWLRAEQTNVWVRETVQAEPAEPAQEPHFDFGQIYKLIQLINEHNAAWQEWFTSAGIKPHLVRYEELDANPVGVTLDVLGFLGLDLPSERGISVRHRRLADELSAQWIDRYRREALER